MTPAVESPEYRTRQRTIETTGKVQFNEESLVRVHAPATGRVLEVLARPGDVVEPGARLFVLDSPDLGAAKADYAKAVADAERSAAAAQLSRELYDAQAVAQKELREAENDARKAVAERERAASRLQTLGVSPKQFADIAARADAATTIVVRAPRGGVVVERNVAAGQVVAYGQSDTPVNLFVVADLSTMWVVADVYEPDVPRLKHDEPMVATLRCCPGERYEGRVSYISDAVDKDTRTVKVRSTVVNRGRTLKAEMFVNVAIATGTSRVLTVSQSAVHREGGETYVLVAKAKDQLERRPVVLGEDMGDAVEVTSGLSAEDRVVTTGSILLKATTR
jgi:cobalt-zinc-cadmium efflux system membrane fusion protein